MKTLTVEQMVALEKAADASGYSYAQMMQAAGEQLARRALANLPATLTRPAKILLLIGKGNNGGDGLVAALELKAAHPALEVSAYLLASRTDELVAGAKAAGVFVVEMPYDLQFRVLQNLLLGADMLIDALFGTGTRLPIEGEAGKLLRQVQGILKVRAESARQSTDPTRPFILACDCPSGVDCNTGMIDVKTITADETVTFAAAKVGLLGSPAREKCGVLTVVEIGIPAHLPEWQALQETNL